MLLGEQFVDEALIFAKEKNPGLKDVNPNRLRRLAERAASEMAAFEELARVRPLWVPKTPEGAKRIIALWDLSYVGTALKPKQKDRWQYVEWAWGTDRMRLIHSVALMVRINQVKKGRSSNAPFNMPKGTQLSAEQLNALRFDLEDSAPWMIYGSTLEQNDDLRTALSQEGVAIPMSRVHIIDFPGKPTGVNTLDQIRAFSMPPGLQIQAGDVLGVVGHAPHLVRAFHMLNKYPERLPVGLRVLPFPMQSISFAGIECAKSEMSGLLSYALIAWDASEEMYPYIERF